MYILCCCILRACIQTHTTKVKPESKRGSERRSNDRFHFLMHVEVMEIMYVNLKIYYFVRVCARARARVCVYTTRPHAKANSVQNQIVDSVCVYSFSSLRRDRLCMRHPRFRVQHHSTSRRHHPGIDRLYTINCQLMLDCIFFTLTIASEITHLVL
ncbi:hypothetical protein P5V15_011229 [Pogonomyrmex californicus]